MKRHRRSSDRGQALVEFALALTVFLGMLMGVFDLGKGIYMYNGVSQAAREIARVTSVHPGTTLGGSAETAAVIATQKGLVPSLGDPTFSCVDVAGNPKASACESGDLVKVRIVAPYRPITPLLSLTGTWAMQGSSSVEIQ
jgi:Flp pilus assembly protein TadG